MSMTRNDAIKHFTAKKYAGKSILQAINEAPLSVKNGLHPKDILWIDKFGYVDAYAAVQMMFARGAANPDGICAELKQR